VAVGIYAEALRGLLHGRAFAGRGDAGLLVVFLGLGGVATATVVVLVVGPVVALVFRALVALALGLVVRGLLGRRLLVLEVGFALRLLLEVCLALRLLREVGLALGLAIVLALFEILVLFEVLGDVVRPELVSFDPAAVREPVADPLGHIAHPLGHIANHVRETGDLAQRAQRTQLAQLRRLRTDDPGRGDKHRPGGNRLDSAVAVTTAAVLPGSRLVVLALERRLDGRRDDPTHINRHLLPPFGTAQEREPLFLRLELDRLPLRPFEDERPFAVVRLLPPLDEPLPFDELLPRLGEERPRAPEDDAFEPPEDDLERPPDDEFPPRLEADDLDLRDEELRLRPLDDELLLLLTSPSSITPRQDPVSSSSIIT
jgi:hypothetical protein